MAGSYCQDYRPVSSLWSSNDTQFVVGSTSSFVFGRSGILKLTAVADNRPSGVRRALDRHLEPALLHPRRHRGVQSGRAGRLGVECRQRSEALRRGLFDVGDHLVEFLPIGLAVGLEVVAWLFRSVQWMRDAAH
jgi:hypothetical protein